MVSTITKALIPAAGQGSRLQPLTCALPKELLPVGDWPMIHCSVCEAITAGVREIYVVINKRHKQALEDFYRRSDWRTGEWSRRGGCHPELASECDLVFLDQPTPLGVVDAMDKARDYLGNEPFFLLMPDTVFFGATAACVQLRDAFERQPGNILGLGEITRDTAVAFSDSGGVALEPLAERWFRVTALLDKSRATLELKAAERVLRVCGRYILTQDFFAEAGNLAPEELTQMDEIPVLRRLLEQKKVCALRLDGALFDGGNWQGYWAANRAWMRRKGWLA